MEFACVNKVVSVIKLAVKKFCNMSKYILKKQKMTKNDKNNNLRLKIDGDVV